MDLPEMTTDGGPSSAKRRLKAVALRIQMLGELVRERDRLRAANGRLTKQRDHWKAEFERYRTWQPPGHFASPIPDADEVMTKADRIFDRSKRELPGVEMNEAGQLALLEELKRFYPEMPFSPGGSEGLRYRFVNRYYGYTDAIILYALIRHLSPKRIVEIGSGHSSAVIMDTNERFFAGGISCTFIEPYPEERLDELLRPGDEERYEVIRLAVQDVDPERYAALEAGDILFIDSTHVSKMGSDVNQLFFEVLPRLPVGVWVHIHDVFYPFEYPVRWLKQGRAWNEAYLLRALLMYGSAFEIALFNDYLTTFHRAWFVREMPLCLENTGGSIWLRRI